jgi:hypothetical protein
LTIDLTSGFWQMEMAADSREYTAFTVGKGTRYQWKVALMGLQGSPASFARLMDFLMRGLTGVLTYIDDVLVHTGCHKEMLQQLEGTLLRLRQFDLKMNVAKSIFGTSEVQYLGYTLRPEGVSPSKDKLGALRAFPPPTSPKQIREFVGICNYFRFLVPSFSRQAAPLLKLTRATAKWKEGPLPPEALTAFQDLKKALISKPIVGHPARDKRFILHTDGALGNAANAGGLGAVLMQEGDDGNDRVIAYASRQLKGYKKNYSAFLLEMQADVFGIEHFDVYLRAKQFTLFTDHKPMEKLGTVHKRTLNRLQVLMTEYDFTMQYWRGCDNAVADFLSRNAPEQEEIGNGSTDFWDRGAPMELVVDAILDITDTEESVEMAQHSDEKLNDVREYLISKTLMSREQRYAI